MSEERVRELSATLADKLIEQAKLKREGDKISEIIRVETEIVGLRREINQELRALSLESQTELDVEE
jgi:hypothetical protein